MSVQNKYTTTRRAILKAGLAGAGALISPWAVPAFAGRGTTDSGPLSEIKIPITMCHGLNDQLSLERFTEYMQIASELGFSAINYDQLYAWLTGTATLPKKPIMFDFDHPMLSICTEMFQVMQQYGFIGNLFVNTGFFGKLCEEYSAKAGRQLCATWDQIGALMQAGWTIGAHTHTHPNLSELLASDPYGDLIRAEMETNDNLIKENLGMTPQYFAFTGNATGSTWSSVADREAQKRYRLGRLWIIGSQCEADGKIMRYADLAGVPGPDESDSGPPYAARYITCDTPFFKLPSMELQALIYEPEAFRAYLLGAASSKL